MKTSQTDPNWTSGNPLKTTWTYDDFARRTSEVRPDGTSTIWSYAVCSTNGCINNNNEMTVTATVYDSGGGTQSVQNTYLDVIDRPLVTSRTMLSGSYDRNEVRYDNLGRVVKQSMPCVWTAPSTSCTYWTTNTYDVIDRLLTSQRPISATNGNPQTTTYGYEGRTSTVQDALVNTTTKINLVTGPMAQSKDATGYYQMFTYDEFGSLTAVTDSASNALFGATYAYGISAFQTSSKDMDLGPRAYTIDPLGEVTAYSDNKSQSFSQTYDLLSRPLIRTEPDTTTTWTWGSTAASYNIGRLQSVSTLGPDGGTYSESYAFSHRNRGRYRIIGWRRDHSLPRCECESDCPGHVSIQ